LRTVPGEEVWVLATRLNWTILRKKKSPRADAARAGLPGLRAPRVSAIKVDRPRPPKFGGLFLCGAALLLRLGFLPIYRIIEFRPTRIVPASRTRGDGFQHVRHGGIPTVLLCQR